jgi:hypothetical protein
MAWDSSNRCFELLCWFGAPCNSPVRAECILDGQTLGEIDARADVDQAVFEVQAMLFAANFLFVMSNDPNRLTQARRGVDGVLARFAVRTAPKKRRSPRR